MGWFAWIIFGFIAGTLAKWIMPGKDPGGFIVTILIGIAGAVVGGYLGNMFFATSVSGFNFSSLFVSVGGAVLLLWVYRLIKKK